MASRNNEHIEGYIVHRLTVFTESADSIYKSWCPWRGGGNKLCVFLFSPSIYKGPRTETSITKRCLRKKILKNIGLKIIYFGSEMLMFFLLSVYFKYPPVAIYMHLPSPRHANTSFLTFPCVGQAPWQDIWACLHKSVLSCQTKAPSKSLVVTVCLTSKIMFLWKAHELYTN